MSVFDFFRVTKKSVGDTIDHQANLAESIFKYVFEDRYVSDSVKQNVNAAISNCTTRQEKLDVIVQLCSPATTSQRRYLQAIALAWSNKERRLDAITALRSYLLGDLYPEAYINIKHSKVLGEYPNEKDIHISTMYTYLGGILEKEYKFQEALDAYEKALKATPYRSTAYSNVAGILIKMNQKENALQIVERAKASEYYTVYHYIDILGRECTDREFVRSIDSLEKRIKEKIQNGYVYKPRPRKK